MSALFVFSSLALSLSLFSLVTTVNKHVCSLGMQCKAVQRYTPCTMSPSSRAGGDFANTNQQRLAPPPLPPSPDCHTFDLAAGGLRNPRSSITAQPLLSADADAAAAAVADARRAAPSSTPTVLGVYVLLLALPRPASPRLVFPLAPWCSPNLSAPCPPPTIRAVVCPLALTSLACPDESFPRRGPAGPMPAKSTATPES